ncbi:signal-transducing adaptor protein 1-like [Odontesthes bonariensis]|uniref:signal-transducing adaptor protein 1-like n=1 Tax=Odontesthes bonariensis TaxID=219752 RepID=UPI003F5840E8
MQKRARRTRNQLTDSYYEGYLEKKSFKDKTSRKLWTCLCGNTIFFFNDMRDTEYIEKLDLSDFISVTDDRRPDRNLDAAKFNLLMKEGNIKLSAPNAETRELWKGYIHAVAELSVPSSLNLLPGQIQTLREAVTREKDRTRSSSVSTVTECSPYIIPLADMPACYHRVSRVEAELLLEREAKRGNLLLRPGSDGSSFAITTKQDLEGAIIKHYRVTHAHGGGFIIDVENPILCPTLHDVIVFLTESTNGSLIPLNIEQPYEMNISFISSDNESGEKTQQALPKSAPPTVPPKPVSHKIAYPEPDHAPVEEDLSWNDKLKKEENESDDSCAVPQPVPAQRATMKILVPPVPAPRRMAPASSAPASSGPSNANGDPKITTNKDFEKQIPKSAISELKLRFKQKATFHD